LVAGGGGLTYAHPLLLLFLVIGTWGFVKRRRGPVAAGLLGVFLVTWQPTAWLAVQPLEAWYRPQPPQTAGGEAIVVLAAGSTPAEDAELQASLKENTYLRCRHGLAIWRRNPRLPILLCGGRSDVVPTPTAAIMRRMLAEEGVPDTLLWTEERSTSTYENALYGAQILRGKGIRRIVLVTEAYHMLRSERCFRKQGLEVIPAACNFSTVATEANGFLPGPGALLANEDTLHEILGLGWYLIKGRI
jgi:uncharacterized SAM-binding protein YcdF (DUF218 family)